jgi:hypothetical protein
VGDKHNEADEIADALTLIAWGLLLMLGGVAMFAGWLTLKVATFASVGALLVPVGLRLGSRLLSQIIGSE